MAALIRQTNSGNKLASKPKIKTKAYGGREERENKATTTNTFWKERGGRKCQRATWQRLDTRNPWTRYNPLSSDNNTAGQQTLTRLPPPPPPPPPPPGPTRPLEMNDATQETKGAEREKSVNGKNWPNPKPLPREATKSLVYWTRTNKTFSSLRMMKQTQINWGK